MEDKLLIWKLKKGSNEALRRIYEKYEEHLLASAISLLYDVSAAEDIVHDVFVSFAQSADKLKLSGNLKDHLTRCVVNLAHDKIRAQQRHHIGLNKIHSAGSDLQQPFHAVINGQSVETIVELVKSEKSKRLGRKTIDGREAEGFKVENSAIAGALVPIEFDSLKARLWIDIETSLPLRYEAEIVTRDKLITLLTKGKAVNVKVTGDQFQWDVELEADVFDPNIPEDFKLLEF